MSPAVAVYREFAPCRALREHIRAFAAFTIPPDLVPVQGRLITREVVFRAGEPYWSRLFADGHLSMVFSIGDGYRVDGLWEPRASEPGGHVIGSMGTARAASHGERLVQVGAYFRAASSPLFTRVPASELSGRIVATADLWGAEAIDVETGIREAVGDAARVDCLEMALLRRMADARRSALDVAGLAASVVAARGQRSVESLAWEAGVSRQHLARVFRETVGVSPKLYSRLARFQAGLAYANRGVGVDWASAALEMGYTDQSHMIAEFREFSGLTPGALAAPRSFHPFMERD